MSESPKLKNREKPMQLTQGDELLWLILNSLQLKNEQLPQKGNMERKEKQDRLSMNPEERKQVGRHGMNQE
jgi:hypothetical protein